VIAPVHSGKNIVTDVSQVTMGLDRMNDLLIGRRKDILRYGAAIMKQETARAFASGVDPNTDRPWPPRKHSYPWPMLNHFGNLRRILTFGWGITKKNNKPRIFGKVKDVVFIQRSHRGGVGDNANMRKSAMEVVGAIFYGRKHARTVEGWREKRGGRMVWSRGGGKTQDAATTGTTPPRPFFGFGKSAKRRIKDYGEKMLARVFDRAAA
jgi:phage gpG-like protein